MLINNLKVVGISEYSISGVARFVSVVPGVCAACVGELCVAGGAIALLALFDALLCLQWVKPVQGDRSKKCYFQHLQAFFHLPVLDDPCRR